MDYEKQPKNDADAEAPEKLIKALRNLRRPHPGVPPAVDQRILAMARERLAKPVARRPVFGRWPVWATAAAAALVVGFFIFQGSFHSSNPNTPASTFAREDINHDGRIDILDALALARQIEAGSVAKSSGDVNADGVVSPGDVQTIAQHAVQLDRAL
jgi:hypothetical protein